MLGKEFKTQLKKRQIQNNYLKQKSKNNEQEKFNQSS